MHEPENEKQRIRQAAQEIVTSGFCPGWMMVDKSRAEVNAIREGS